MFGATPPPQVRYAIQKLIFHDPSTKYSTLAMFRKYLTTISQFPVFTAKQKLWHNVVEAFHQHKYVFRVVPLRISREQSACVNSNSSFLKSDLTNWALSGTVGNMTSTNIDPEIQPFSEFIFVGKHRGEKYPVLNSSSVPSTDFKKQIPDLDVQFDAVLLGNYQAHVSDLLEQASHSLKFIQHVSSLDNDMLVSLMLSHSQPSTKIHV